MCTACGPFGPCVQAGSRRDFPGSLKGRPQHRSLRACRRHEHTRQLPPHGRADPAPCSFPPAVLRREVPSLSAEHRNLSKDRAALGQEIRKSVAELSTRLRSPARRSRSRVLLTSTPRGQPPHEMRTVSTARSRDAPAMHHHGTSGSRADPGHPVPSRAAIANSLVRSGVPDRLFGVFAPRTQIHGFDLRLFVYRLERASNAAGHRHGSSTPSQTATLRACDGTASSAADVVNRRLRVSTDARCSCSALTWLIASRAASRFRQYSSEGPVTSASKPQSRIPRSASDPRARRTPGSRAYQPVRRQNHRRCRRAATPRPASLIHLWRRGRCAAR